MKNFQSEELRVPLLEFGKDLIGYIPSKLVPSLTSILAIIIYTRLIEPQEYGLLILVMTTVSFACSFTFDWIGYAIWRYFEKYKNQQKLPKFIGTAIISTMSAFLLISIIWYVTTIFLKTNGYFIHLLRIGILVLGVQSGYQFILLILRLERKSFKYSLYSSVGAVSSLLLAIFFLFYLSTGVEGILFANIISIGVISIFGLINYQRRLKIKFSYFSKEIARKIISFGTPQLGIIIGALLLSLCDRYMINYFIGTKEVGVYNAGYRVAEFSLQFFHGLLILAALPIMMQTFENKGKEETIRLLKIFLNVYLLVLIPITFGLIALSKDFVKVLLGKQFQDAFVVVPWVTGGIFFFGLSQYINMPIQLKEKPIYLLYLILGAGLLNILLNIFMIPHSGIIGAARATFIAYLVYLMTSWLVSIRFMRFKFPWVPLVKSLLAALIMYFILVLRGNILSVKFTLNFLLLKIVIGFLVYLGTLYLLQEKTLLIILNEINNKMKRLQK